MVNARSGARNVRIARLSADRPVASIDCPTCVKRRIKCDRTAPKCFKCASRRLECPGFQAVYLKWDQGIASRGRFAGQPSPVVQATAEQLPDPASDTRVVQAATASTLLDSLTDHFCTNVVSRLTWVDTPEHPLRATIKQLLRQPSSLRLSVGSLAAAHLSMMHGEGGRDSPYFDVYAQLRDRSLRALSDTMRQASAAQSGSMIHMLASMLLLFYAEAFIPGSKEWGVHLRGCRTVVGLDTFQSALETSEASGEGKFLLKEVADLEIFTGISVFEEEEDMPAATLLRPRQQGIWAFTDLVHEITRQERNTHRHRHGQTDMSVDEWRSRIEGAYRHILSGIDAVPGYHGELRQCFDLVARAHYYCTLIYCYQALYPDMRESIKSLLGPLWQDINVVMRSPIDTLFHNMFFPFFIAGTECVDISEQETIEQMFLQSLAKTGIWCNFAALQFLREFWEDSGSSWLQFGRTRGSKIQGFIIF